MRGWNDGFNTGFGGGWQPRGFGYGMGFPWGEALLFLVLAVAIAAIAWFAWKAVRAARTRKAAIPTTLSGTGLPAGQASAACVGRAMDILLERYARGEIDADTLASMRAEIARSAGPDA